MSNVDPVAVAKRWLDNYRRAHVADGGVTVDVNEAIALARAVIAAAIVSETIPSSYDPHDDLVVRHAQALNALVEALKGEK